MSSEKKCPVSGKSEKDIASTGTTNKDGWPDQVNLKMLHQHSSKSNPLGETFN